MKTRTVITVDGLAGSGKTTLARLLAEKLGFRHLNTGLFYRGVALVSLQHGLAANDERGLLDALVAHRLELIVNSAGEVTLLVDGVDRGEEARRPEVSERTSQIAVFKGVRDYLVEPQRHCFGDCPIVAEGRDMGTIIFTDAPLKFFVQADVNVRIARRMQQLYGASNSLSEERRNTLKREIEIEIIERDKRDSERALAPTVAAQDALIIDNSRERLTDVVQKMYDFAVSRGLRPQ